MNRIPINFWSLLLSWHDIGDLSIAESIDGVA
jgi:hypothetical protein